MQGPFTGRKRQVNEMMCEALQKRPDDRPIPFFCECDDERCYQAVWLTGPEFEEARRDPDWLALVPSHRAALRPRSVA